MYPGLEARIARLDLEDLREAWIDFPTYMVLFCQWLSLLMLRLFSIQDLVDLPNRLLQHEQQLCLMLHTALRHHTRLTTENSIHSPSH